MFDPAMLEALHLPLPPEPPRVVEERMWLSDAGVKAQKAAERVVNQYRAMVDSWLARLDRLVGDYQFVEAGPVPAGMIAEFDDMIAEMERTAERKAKGRAQLVKRAARDTKTFFRTDPSLGAVSKAFSAQMVAQEDRVIAAILDHALFLRSVRAERDPTHERGAVFDDPRELTRYLTAAIAA